MTEIEKVAAALAADENFIARLAEAVAKRLTTDAQLRAALNDGGNFPEVAR